MLKYLTYTQSITLPRWMHELEATKYKDEPKPEPEPEPKPEPRVFWFSRPCLGLLAEGRRYLKIFHAHSKQTSNLPED